MRTIFAGAAAGLLGVTVIAGAPAASAAPRAAGRLTAHVATAGTVTVGRPAVLKLAVGHSGTARPARWSLSFGDHTHSVSGKHGPATKVTHTFGTTGWHTVTLTVTPTAGRAVTTREKVLVLSPQPALGGTEVVAPAVQSAATQAATPATAGQPTTAQPDAVHPNTSSVTTVSPSSGPVNTGVTITGTGFTSPATVTFNGVAASATVVSSTQIKTAVPHGASTGTLSVTSNGSTSTSTFTITLGIAAGATSGPPGKEVNVYGSGFAANEQVILYTGESETDTVYTASNGTFSDTSFVPYTYTPAGPTQIGAVGQTSHLATSTPYTIRTDWANLGFGNDHRGWNPYENDLDVRGFGQAFRTSTGDAVTSSASVAAGGVYLATDESVKDFNASTGAPVWSTSVAGISYSTPAVVGSSVYVSDSEGVYDLSATSGTVIWHKTSTLNLEYSSPTVVSNIVYSAGGGSVLALNATTGANVWSFASSSSSSYSSPTVVNGVVYFSSSDNKIYAIDAVMGTQLWTYSATGFSEGTMPVVNGVIYAGLSDDYVYAIDAQSGALRWKYNTGAAVYASAAVGGDDHVYVGNSAGTTVSLDAGTGALIWSVARSGEIAGQPTYADGYVFFTSEDGSIYAASTYDGSSVWTASIGDLVFTASPTVVNGTVYVGSSYGYVFAFNAAGGSAETA